MVALGWLGTDLGRLYVNDWGPEHAATGSFPRGLSCQVLVPGQDVMGVDFFVTTSTYILMMIYSMLAAGGDGV